MPASDVIVFNRYHDEAYEAGIDKWIPPGVRFEFAGTVDRGQGKTPADEAYHIIKGTLTDFHPAADKKAASTSRAVVFKSFPQDAQ